ncbi:MAG: amino acid ABC transporter permease [Actinomycetia bacterium]|nr:amino acid ABC transporter permease [Actinomycetes bacterium]
MDGLLTQFLTRWEANPITHIFFSPQIAWESLPFVAKGFPVTIILGVLSFLLAIPMGLALAFMKMSRVKLANWLATAYIDVVRGTPMILFILVIYMSLPLIPAYQMLIAPFKSFEFLGISFSSWLRSFIILSCNSAAYFAEILRAGIQSIPKGQMEAARSLGMKTRLAMAYVILPQTIRRILPTSMSEFILILKDTALLSTVSIYEVMLRAKLLSSKNMNSTPLVLAALFYLAVTIPTGRFVARLENKLAEQDSGSVGGTLTKGKRPPRLDVDSDQVIPHEENVLVGVV